MLRKLMTPKNLVIVAFMVLALCSNDMYAQLELPDAGEVLDEPEAPIDGFISIALAIGAYFGVKKLRKN
jgi:hypothetical protein